MNDSNPKNSDGGMVAAAGASVDRQDSLKERAAQRLMAAELSFHRAQTELRASGGSERARKLYKDARDALDEAEQFAVGLAESQGD